MATAEVTETVDRPIEEVFALISRPELHPQWQQDLESDGYVSGDGEVGTLGREVRKVMGKTLTTEYQITAFDPPQTWGFASVKGPVPTSGTLTCVEVEGGTLVTARLTFSGWSGEAMARFAKRQFKQHLHGLKVLAESRAPAESKASADGSVPAADQR